VLIFFLTTVTIIAIFISDIHNSRIMSLIQYLKQVNQAISSQDGDTFGKLMKLTGKSPLTDKVQNDIKRVRIVNVSKSQIWR
jgi:hypothetical protein